MSAQKGFQSIGDDFASLGASGAPNAKVANREKMEILERYSVVFEEDNVYTYNILPILLSKPYLLSKIEMFYDRQFEELLKKKSLAALDFPHIVHESMKSKFRESKNYFVQSLSNIIYSGEKYSEGNEITLFLEFCQKKGENQKLLFFLFLRQHFKILTYTTFLSHYKTSSDPSKITISFDNAIDILTVAFSHEKVAQDKLLDAVRGQWAKGSKIGYYDFMMACMGVRMIYSDLPMLDKAVALYRVTNFAELSNALAQKNMIEIGSAQQQSGRFNQTGDGRVVGAASTDLSGNNAARSMLRPKSDIASIINPKSRQLFQAVKAEIKPYTERLVSQFLEKNGLDPQDVADQLHVVDQHIQKKLFFIVSAIFAEDRRRFLAVLRTDVESNGQILEFWMDLQDTVKESHRMGLVNSNVAQDFLKRVNGNPTVSGQIGFLLNFRLLMREEQFDCSLAV